MISEKDSGRSELSATGSRKMPFTAAAVSEELTSAVKELVQAAPEPSTKARLRSVARHIGLPIGRVQDYLYGEVRCPPAHEADLIRAYYKAAEKLVKARRDYDQLRQRFLSEHPSLARFAPRGLSEDTISAEAEAAATSELARRRL